MVEEMNRYNETPEEVLRYLNVRPEFGHGARYKVETLIVKGQEIPSRHIYSGSSWYVNPLMSVIQVQFEKPRTRRPREPRAPPEDAWEKEYDPYGEEEDDRYQPQTVDFMPDQVEQMDALTGTYWYWNEQYQARLILSKHQTVRTASPLDNLDRLSTLMSQGVVQGDAGAPVASQTEEVDTHEL